MALLNLRPRTSNDFIQLVQSSHKRKDDARLRLDLYEDEQVDAIYAAIAGKWDSDTKALFRPVFVNFLKKIIRRTASVYVKPPRRTFTGMDQTQGEDLYASLNANSIMKRASQLTKLCKTTALQVLHDGDRPRLCLITPNILDAEWTYPDDPDRLIVTHLAERPEDVTYSDWSRTGWAKRDARGNILDTQPNAYGILPFVPLFDRAPDSEFFLRGGRDLVEAQATANSLLTHLAMACALQSHGQAVLSSAVQQTSLDVTRLGPNTLLHIPEAASFDYKAPETPVEEILSTVEFIIRQSCVANDLSSDVFDLRTVPESGSARMAANRDLVEARRDDLDNWREYEQKCFQMLKTVINTHAPNTIPEDATLQVEFADVSQNITEQERLEGYRTRIQLGTWSPVDAHLAENPDQTREQALAELELRREEGAALGLDFSGVTDISNIEDV